jgi:hypothetical protein
MVAKIKHCPISSKFDMWVDDDDVPTLKNVYRLPFQNGRRSKATFENVGNQFRSS